VAEETAEATAERQAAADELRQPMLDLLQAELGGDLVGHELHAGDDLCIRVQASAWRRTAALCRDRLGLTYFCFLSGIDWQPNPDLLGEKAWEPEEETAEGAEPTEAAALRTGVAGGDTRFQVFARLYNIATHVGITLKADLDETDPRVDSLVPLFRGADWHEREAWEMYGFTFDGHPKLRHLYLPGEFEGYPLRKDFPLLARLVKPWPGLVDVEPMPGEEVEDVAIPGDEG
jgi:NADH-quinone oxidoreductase subunit C